MRIPGTSLEVALRSAEASSAAIGADIGRELAIPPGGALVGPEDNIVSGASGVAGIDGTGAWYDDKIPGGWDSNPELLGRLKYPVYREMRLSDPAIRSLEWMFKLPIRSADWGIKANAKDPEQGGATLRADYIAAQFGLESHVGAGKLDITWDELNEQDLLYLSYGAQGAELVWDDLSTWFDEEGGEHAVRFLSRLMPIMASTVAEIELDKVKGTILRVKQDLPGADWIPGPAADRPKLHWLVNEREGANWYGQSLLRAAYGAWLIKKSLLIGGAIAFDRWSSGIPVVYHPPGKQKEAIAIARNLRSHERAWVTAEGPPADTPNGGDWLVRIEKGEIESPVEFLRHLDQQIAMGGVEQFSSLGNSQHGSRAVGETLSDPFYMAVQSVADRVRLARMRYVVRRLIDVNWGPQYPIPEVTVSKIQGRNVAVLARALADLTAAGFSFTDRDTQNDVRDVLDMRHLPEGIAGTIDGLPPEVGVAAEGGSIVGGQYALSRDEFEEALERDRVTVVSMLGDRIEAALARVFPAKG